MLDYVLNIWEKNALMILCVYGGGREYQNFSPKF